LQPSGKAIRKKLGHAEYHVPKGEMRSAGSPDELYDLFASLGRQGAGIVIGCTAPHYDLRNFGMISIIRAANAIPQQNPTAIDLTMSKPRIACECRASRTFRSGGNEKNSGIMKPKISLRGELYSGEGRNHKRRLRCHVVNLVASSCLAQGGGKIAQSSLGNSGVLLVSTSAASASVKPAK
jgi:hypothetical protein